MYMQYVIVELKYANRQHGCFNFPYWLPHVPPPLCALIQSVIHPVLRSRLEVMYHDKQGGGLWVLFLEDPPYGFPSV